MTAAVRTGSAAARFGRGQDVLFVALRLAGWLATNLLVSLGMGALFFIVLGSFSLGGTMLQLDNLASRYLAADAARQLQFRTITSLALGLAFALVAYFRRAGLREAVDLEGGAA